MPNKYYHKYFYSDTQKECPRCKEIKSHSDFHKHKRTSDGLNYYCKTCASERSRKWHKENKHRREVKEAKRNIWIKTTHKITLEEYKQKLHNQDYKCAVCSTVLKESGPLTHLDHCHNTGLIREFLCTNCNRGLGHFHDNTEVLMNAIKYLNRHRDIAESKRRAEVYE